MGLQPQQKPIFNPGGHYSHTMADYLFKFPYKCFITWETYIRKLFGSIV